MEEKEFNLLDEPWILALNEGGEPEDFGLLAILEQAHRLKALAGELPTQDVAILRLLLATLYATFTRADENGQRAPLQTAEEALRRWNALWQRGSLPIEPIRKRLEFYRERFYLFHPERPFYQVAGLSKGTHYEAAKLMGDISESGNKPRLFQTRSGTAKAALGYAEAARWLLYLNAFDDTSSKPSRDTGRKLPSPGAGWLGKLGIVFAIGESLFETLMLNLSLLDDSGAPWEEGNAVWELETVRSDERMEIFLPRSQAALLTLQSRRLLLERNGRHVTGYRLLGGDFFPKENSFSEQMTVWRKDSAKQDEIVTPRRHDSSRQLWRDFASLMSVSPAFRRPGIISWLSVLESNDLIPARRIRIQAAAVKYGDKDFFVDDVWGDSLSLNALVLAEVGEIWVTRIIDLLSVTEDCVRRLGYLASDVAAAAGDKNGSGRKRNAAIEEAYFRLDIPFRSWIEGIDPNCDDMSIKGNEWKERMKGIITALGEELIRESGANAFVGKTVTDRNGRKEWITAPAAYSKFNRSIHHLLTR